MRALFYDTETSGLPLFSEPSEHPAQPHIVQLGAALVDLDTRKTLASIDLIVRPDGWTIPDDVAAIHGITTERAMDVGVSESMALGMLLELWERAEVRFDEAHADEWKAGKASCTQLLSTPILKLPPTEKMRKAGRFHHKSANLGEAYQHFTGKPLDGAHSAMVDVQACMAVWFAIQDLQSPAPAAA